MPAQALYLKWRPRTFDDVIGQGHITRTLRNQLAMDRVRHAYLFNGPRGTGKTTMARLLAKAVNCLHPVPAVRPCDECAYCLAINEGRFLDLIEIDAASNNSVDDVRDLREKIAFAPAEGRFKVYIIDEVHRFSGAAFDALLKTLEEPPDHAIFILATTELDKVPQTIRSRSLSFEFRRVALNDVAERLAQIAEEEGVRIERAAVELIAGQGTGSVRDSISLLDQLIADPDEVVTAEMAARALGTAGVRVISALAEAIISGQDAEGIDLINRAIDDGADPAQLGRQIVEYLRQLLLVQTGGPSLVEAGEETRAALQAQASRIGRGALIRAVRAFNAAVSEVRSGWQPQLPLELALIEAARQTPDAPAVPTEAPVRRAAPPAATQTAPAVAAEVPASGPASALSLARLRDGWPDMCQKLSDHKDYRSLGNHLGQAWPAALESNHRTVVLRVRTQTVKRRLEEQQAVMDRAIARYFGAEGLRARVETGAVAADGATIDAATDEIIAQQLRAGGKVVDEE